jgi:hypothetical protein
VRFDVRVVSARVRVCSLRPAMPKRQRTTETAALVLKFPCFPSLMSTPASCPCLDLDIGTVSSQQITLMHPHSNSMEPYPTTGPISVHGILSIRRSKSFADVRSLPSHLIHPKHSLCKLRSVDIDISTISTMKHPSYHVASIMQVTLGCSSSSPGCPLFSFMLSTSSSRSSLCSAGLASRIYSQPILLTLFMYFSRDLPQIPICSQDQAQSSAQAYHG